MTAAVEVSAVNRMLQAWADAFRPQPRLSTVEWATTHLKIPAGAGARPGRYTLDGHEYLRGPLAAVDDPEVEQIVLKFPTQVGKTTLLQAVLASRDDLSPAPAMLAGPDQDEIRKLRDDFYRFCEASPRMRHRIPPERLRNDRWIDFGRCRAYLAWSGNTQKLSGKSVQLVLATEIDHWQQSPKEGSTQKLVINRVKAFFRSLIIWESTPTNEDSAIDALYKRSNRCRFLCPCPHCNHFQELRFYLHKDGKFAGNGGIDGLKDKKGNWHTADDVIETAYYRCEKGCRIENADKAGMVEAGQWIPAGQSLDSAGRLRGKPDRTPRVSGFTMTSLVAEPISIGKMAAAYVEAVGNDKDMQDFSNNWLAWRWKVRAKVPKWSVIAKRLAGGHSRGTAPPAALFATAGIDKQADRCYWVARGWGEKCTSWLLDWGVCTMRIGANGQLIRNSDLEQLVALLIRRRFPFTTPNPLGWTHLPVRLMGIDTGFKPAQVWDWVRAQPGDQVRAIAGDSQMNDPFFRMTTVEKNARTGKVYPGGMKRWGINTHTYKSDIQQRWSQPTDEPGAWFLTSAGLEEAETYLKQITNEGTVPATTSKHRHAVKWEVIEAAIGNHYWDCEVYARAMADMVTGLEWDNLIDQARTQEQASLGRSAGEDDDYSAR